MRRVVVGEEVVVEEVVVWLGRYEAVDECESG